MCDDWEVADLVGCDLGEESRRINRLHRVTLVGPDHPGASLLLHCVPHLTVIRHKGMQLWECQTAEGLLPRQIVERRKTCVVQRQARLFRTVAEQVRDGLGNRGRVAAVVSAAGCTFPRRHGCRCVRLGVRAVGAALRVRELCVVVGMWTRGPKNCRLN